MLVNKVASNPVDRIMKLSEPALKLRANADSSRLGKFLADNNNNNIKPITLLGSFALALNTALNVFEYFKNKESLKNSEYKGEILNDILNDAVAKLNTDIYCDKHRDINGFKQVMSKNDKLTGFFAIARKQDSEIFITYCGTNNKPAWVSDLQMAFGFIPSQFKHADKFYQDVKKKYPDCDITITGHSLGGSLAQLISSKYKDVPSITMNSFGVDTIIKRNPKIFKDNHNVYNYIINGDFISNSSAQVGKTVMLEGSDEDVHDMRNYVNRWA